MKIVTRIRENKIVTNRFNRLQNQLVLFQFGQHMIEGNIILRKEFESDGLEIIQLRSWFLEMIQNQKSQRLRHPHVTYVPRITMENQHLGFLFGRLLRRAFESHPIEYLVLEHASRHGWIGSAGSFLWSRRVNESQQIRQFVFSEFSDKRLNFLRLKKFWKRQNTIVQLPIIRRVFGKIFFAQVKPFVA